MAENKEGSKADGVTSNAKLKAAAAAYKKKKSKMSPAQRKKVEARLKSSKQRLTGDGHMNLSETKDGSQPLIVVPDTNNDGSLVDLALGKTGKRNFNPANRVRAQGGRFGNTGGVQARGASNNSATGNAKTDTASLVKNFQIGQSITLPNSTVKIKRVENGYQVYDGSTNKNRLVKTPEDAIMAAQTLARKGGKNVANQNADTDKQRRTSSSSFR